MQRPEVVALDWSVLDEKLYDREREVQALEAAYRCCTCSGKKSPELVLVTGTSGTGKTTRASLHSAQEGGAERWVLSYGKVV